jgi:hypothetical protein
MVLSGFTWLLSQTCEI